MSNVHKYVEVKPDNEVDKLLIDQFTYPIKDTWLEVGDGKTLLPARYRTTLADDIEDFDVRDDDIFVVSFPRSGTTWTCEMVWMVHNDCDFEAGRSLLHGRFSYMEGSVFASTDIYEKLKCYDKHMNMEHIKSQKDRPRYFKTHLPWPLLPRKVREGIVKPKMIWISRNPKDVCISEYHFYKSLHNFNASLEDFHKLFLSGRSHYGSYWTHYYSFWNRRHLPNLLCIRYEDMKRKLPSVLKQVSQFLEVPIKDFYMDDLITHLSFSAMKFNFFCNHQIAVEIIRDVTKEEYEKDGIKWKEGKGEHFLRKGKIGGHKEEMTPLMIKKFDDWIAENTKDTDISFD